MPWEASVRKMEKSLYLYKCYVKELRKILEQIKIICLFSMYLVLIDIKPFSMKWKDKTFLRKQIAIEVDGPNSNPNRIRVYIKYS